MPNGYNSAYLGTQHDEYATKSALIDLIYPIGAIYISTVSTNPELLFGGTQTQIQDKFLLCAGSTYTAGSTGGNATHVHSTGNHTLTVSEIPSHNHTQAQHRHTLVANWSSGSGSENAYTYQGSRTAGTTRYTDYQTPTINNTGGGGAHNHGNTGSASTMPPYLAVYVFQRTA